MKKHLSLSVIVALPFSKRSLLIHCHVLKKPLVNDDADISHSILNFLHFLERELRHKTHFQETVDIAGEILLSAAPTVA